MENQYTRTELLIGKEGIEKLKKAKVVIFGIGGVGSFVVEGLARAGIGSFILIDSDEVSESNLNRQLIATTKTVGRAKVEINQEFFMPESEDIFDTSANYIVDAIDTVTAKIEIIVRANKLNIPIISSMGTGNKMDPTRFEIADIYKTSVCPLAKVMRKELRARDIKKLKVLYSREEPIKQAERTAPGSISFVPSVAGLIIAGEVIKDIIREN